MCSPCSHAFVCISEVPSIVAEEAATDTVAPVPGGGGSRGFINTVLSALRQGAGALYPRREQLRLSYCCLERIIWKLAVSLAQTVEKPKHKPGTLSGRWLQWTRAPIPGAATGGRKQGVPRCRSRGSACGPGSWSVSDADVSPGKPRPPGQVCPSPFWHHFDVGKNTLSLERAFCTRGLFQFALRWRSSRTHAPCARPWRERPCPVLRCSCDLSSVGQKHTSWL